MYISKAKRKDISMLSLKAKVNARKGKDSTATDDQRWEAHCVASVCSAGVNLLLGLDVDAAIEDIRYFTTTHRNGAEARRAYIYYVRPYQKIAEVEDYLLQCEVI